MLPLASALASYHPHHLDATQQLLEPGLESLSADVVDKALPLFILLAVFEVSGQPQQSGLLCPDEAEVNTNDPVSLDRPCRCRPETGRIQGWPRRSVGLC